ncbi:MAG: hemolysin family protein [Opitutales bacterium]
MITSWTDFGLTLGGAFLALLVTGFFIACEASLVALRYRLGESEALEDLGKRKRIGFLLRHSKTTAALIRFSTLSCAVIGALLLLVALDYLFDPQGERRGAFWLLLELFVAVSLTSLLGFLLPRGLGLARPHKALRLTSWVVGILAALLLPWFRLQRLIARHVMKILGRPFHEDYNILDFEVQVRALTEEDEGAISPQLQSMLRNTLRMRELDVSDVLLPRHQVKVWNTEETLEENLAMARESGHTRFPLCDGDLDRCEGLIHIKDIFRRKEGTIGLDAMALRREITSFPEETPLEEALQQMLQQKTHMALVRDEFGGTIGVLTLEAILEEIVGRIEDEFDAVEDLRVKPLSDGETYRIDGLAPIHEVEEALGVEVVYEEVSTFGGLVTAQIGYIPQPGEALLLEEPPLSVSVVEADETRLISAEVKVLPQLTEEMDSKD